MNHNFPIAHKDSNNISKEDLLKQLKKGPNGSNQMQYSIESMNFFAKRPHRHVNFTERDSQANQTIQTGNELQDELFMANFGKPKKLGAFQMSRGPSIELKALEDEKQAKKDICLKFLEKYSGESEKASEPSQKEEEAKQEFNVVKAEDGPPLEADGAGKKEIEIICPHLVQYFRKYEKKLSDENKTLKEYKLSTKKSQITIKTPVRRTFPNKYFTNTETVQKGQSGSWERQQNYLTFNQHINIQNVENPNRKMFFNEVPKSDSKPEINFQVNKPKYEHSKGQISEKIKFETFKRQIVQPEGNLLNKRNYEQSFPVAAKPGNEQNLGLVNPISNNEDAPASDFNWDMILKLNLKRDLYLDLNTKHFYLKLNAKDEDIVKATPKLHQIRNRMNPNLNLVPLNADAPKELPSSEPFMKSFGSKQQPQFINQPQSQSNYNFAIQTQHANLNLKDYQEQSFLRRNSGFQKVSNIPEPVRNFVMKPPQPELMISTTKLMSKKSHNQHIDITLNPGPLYVDPRLTQGLFRGPGNMAGLEQRGHRAQRRQMAPVINPGQVQLVSTRPPNRQSGVERMQDLKIKQPNLPMDRLFEHSIDSTAQKELQKKSTRKKRKTRSGCRCSKSKCLRLHCVCFKNGKFCSGECGCLNCYNSHQFSGLVSKVRSATKEINSQAFDSKCVEVVRPTGTFKLTKGCSCFKNNCMKNYCECKKMGLPCSTLCKCDHCYNEFVDLTPTEVAKLSRKVSRKKKKIVFQTKLRSDSGHVRLALPNQY